MTAPQGIEAAVLAAIIGNPAVKQLVGARIYPDVLLQNPPDQVGNFPAITIQWVSEKRSDTFGTADTLPGTLFQVDSWDRTRAGASALARIVKGFPGSPGFANFVGTVAGETIQAVLLENQRNEYFPDVKLYRRSQDYRVWWNED